MCVCVCVCTRVCACVCVYMMCVVLNTHSVYGVNSSCTLPLLHGLVSQNTLRRRSFTCVTTQRAREVCVNSGVRPTFVSMCLCVYVIKGACLPGPR